MRTGKITIQRVFSLLFVLFVCQQTVFSEELELTPGEKRRIESGAIDTFETIISLWKSEKFDEIYDYGDRISREMISKERFISGMKISCRLASSWETIRDTEVEIISPTRVYLKAKMGFAWPCDEWADTVFGTLIFEMTLEDKDEWRIGLSKILYCPNGVSWL
jgi:hypothetical protein